MARQCCETLQIQARAPQENVIIWLAVASMLEKRCVDTLGLLLGLFSPSLARRRQHVDDCVA